MKNRKAIGIGAGMIGIGVIIGIVITMFIVNTNPKKEFEERKTYGTLLEYEEALSQEHQENNALEQEKKGLEQEKQELQQENESLQQQKDTLQKEKQPYAENAYNLGKAEYVGLSVMKPEEAVEFQADIQEIIQSNLTLEEQGKRIEAVLQKLEEYIAEKSKSSGSSIGL